MAFRNCSGRHGGGVFVNEGTDFEFVDSIFEDNTALGAFLVGEPPVVVVNDAWCFPCISRVCV